MASQLTYNTVALPINDDRETLVALRRKLGFRSWHRGTLEADLLIGTFADQHLADFADTELRQFERLLNESDPDIDDWMTGRRLIPKEHDNGVMALLRQFRPVPKSASTFLRLAASTMPAATNGGVGGPQSWDEANRPFSRSEP
jgi:antitoxin CptB